MLKFEGELNRQREKNSQLFKDNIRIAELEEENSQVFRIEYERAKQLNILAQKRDNRTAKGNR